MPSEKDIVVEARAKLAKPGHGMGKRNRELINGLCDEVERLRNRFSVLCGNCGERYLGPRDEHLHGYNVCNMERCEDQTIMPDTELLEEKRKPGDFTFYEPKGNEWICKTCGSTIAASIKYTPVWDGPFPCSGSGEVQSYQLPYCPKCEVKP